MSARVAKLVPSHEIDESVVHSHAGAAAESIRGKGRSFLPPIGGWIVDVDVWKRRLAPSGSRKGAKHVNLCRRTPPVGSDA
jgi:hypothetical protein